MSRCRRWAASGHPAKPTTQPVQLTTFIAYVSVCQLQAPLSDEQVQALGSKRPPPDNDYNFISNWLRGEPEGVYGVSDGSRGRGGAAGVFV
jgi:hypothetical protein